ncbi:MAG: flagellar basal body P-ring formation protein FlgA [Planctomycetes bacterium]|nr:flagellar basal body P-ring formation protein FlgA [Planctomycetota bacterium]
MLRLALIFILLAAPLTATVAVDCTLAKQANIPGGFVSLSQIATLTGDNDVIAQAGKTLLGKAPLKNETREITLDNIKQRLKQSGLDPATFAFYGATSVLVVCSDVAAAKSIEVGSPETGVGRKPLPVEPSKTAPDSLLPTPHADIATLALARITDRFTRRFPGRENQLRVKELSRGRNFDESAKDAKFLDVRPRQAAETLGKLDYEIVTEAQTKGLTISVEVTLEVTRVILVRDISKGAEITAADIALATSSTTDVSLPGFATVGEALGRNIKRALRKGETLSDANSAPGLLVHKGDSLKLKALLPGGGSIVTTATAMENGIKGALIRVRRSSDKKEIEVVARINAAGECIAE